MRAEEGEIGVEKNTIIYKEKCAASEVRAIGSEHRVRYCQRGSKEEASSSVISEVGIESASVDIYSPAGCDVQCSSVGPDVCREACIRNHGPSGNRCFDRSQQKRAIFEGYSFHR